MNDSDFGLSASIWTQDLAAAERLGDRDRHRHRVHEPLRLPRPGAGLDRGARTAGAGSRCRVSAMTPDPAEILSSAPRDLNHGLTANWNYPTSIRFGAGRIAELAEVCRSRGIERPLLVTDSGLANAARSPPRRWTPCAPPGSASALFCDLQPNPIEPTWPAGSTPGAPASTMAWSPSAAAAAWTCGKVIAFMSGQTRPVWDFEDIGDYWTRADAAGIAPGRRGPDHRRHRLRSRPGRQ